MRTTCALNLENHMARKLILALASTVALMAAGTAHAGGVSWSVGINLPGIGTVISNAPVYVPAPVVVYQEPAPVVYQRPAPVYAPAPVIYQQPAPVVYETQRVYYPVPRVVMAPQQVVYVGQAPRWASHGRDHDRDGGRWVRDERRWHHDQRDQRDPREYRAEQRGEHRDEYGDRFNR
jgi:hypothetical protein